MKRWKYTTVAYVKVTPSDDCPTGTKLVLRAETYTVRETADLRRSIKDIYPSVCCIMAEMAEEA